MAFRPLINQLYDDGKSVYKLDEHDVNDVNGRLLSLDVANDSNTVFGSSVKDLKIHSNDFYGLIDCEIFKY